GSRGHLAAREHKPAEAALWFAHTAHLTEKDQQQHADNALRAANWLNDAYLPVGCAQSEYWFPTTLSFQPQGPWLIMLGEAFTGRIWNYEQDTTFALPGGARTIEAACWSQDGKVLAVGWARGEVQLIDARDGRLIKSFTISPGKIHALAFGPRDKHLA